MFVFYFQQLNTNIYYPASTHPHRLLDPGFLRELFGRSDPSRDCRMRVKSHSTNGCAAHCLFTQTAD